MGERHDTNQARRRVAEERDGPLLAEHQRGVMMGATGGGQVGVMQTEEIVFEGTEEERQIARDIWVAMRRLGLAFANDAPIAQPLPKLAAYMAHHPLLVKQGDVAAAVDAALTLNHGVFTREVTADGLVVFSTTKAGRAPLPLVPDMRHTFKTRLTEPEPLPVEVAPSPVAEVSEVVIVPPAAESTTVAPPSDTAPPVTEVLEEEPALPEMAAEAPPAPVAETVVEEPPLMPSPAEAVEDAAVAAALLERLTNDIRLVSFGDAWYLDDQLMRLSRGDFRRIRDYILEQGAPLLDDDLLTIVFGRRPGDREYPLWQFALNQRLSREKREFEFVGTPGARRWSTSGLPTIGTAKRRQADIGQDYRFLLDLPPWPADQPPPTTIEHTLTFYEYEYGLLPLDARMAAFFPKPFLEDQRAAVVQFEAPQIYTSIWVEIRYPTANRGGFLGGLEQFYLENLVPGARITIERGASDGHYLVRFGQTNGEERRLLHFDDRRGRFVFRPVTFYCEVNEDLVLSDTKFPGLNNARPLDDRERRRPEAVLAATFERVGDQVGDKTEPRYWALLDDLYAAANIERPITLESLRMVLESESNGQFEADPDGNAYFYYPRRAQ